MNAVSSLLFIAGYLIFVSAFFESLRSGVGRAPFKVFIRDGATHASILGTALMLTACCTFVPIGMSAWGTIIWITAMSWIVFFVLRLEAMFDHRKFMRMHTDRN